MAPNVFSRPTQLVRQDERIRRSPPGHDILAVLNSLGMLVAKRPLALGESEQAYNNLLTNVSAAVEPGDAIEALSVKDIVDRRWETMRLRRLQASVLMGATRSILANLLHTLVSRLPDSERVFTVSELLTGCDDRGDKMLSEIERVLAHCGKNLDGVMAEAFLNKLDAIGAIDQMITGADVRQSNLLRDIDRRRDAFVRRLRAIGHDTSRK